MRTMALAASILACSASPSTDTEPQALTTEVVCQIGPVDQLNSQAGNSTCEEYAWSWSDGAGNYTKCTDQACVIGNSCHIMGGNFGQVVAGACYTPQDGPKACDATSPWVWIGPGGPTSCLKAPANGAQCWETVNGVCRLATF